MQVILLDKVINVGALGEIVKVKDGYARNFLIPQKLARRATEANKAEFKAKRVKLKKAAAAKLAEAQAQGEKLAGTTVKLTQKAGVDGRLFGSVTNHDIAEELSKQGYKVAKSQVRLPNGPIKTTGETTVSWHLHTTWSRHQRHVLGETLELSSAKSRLRGLFRTPCPETQGSGASVFRVGHSFAVRFSHRCTSPNLPRLS